jgi:hypothetical protein
MRSTSSTVAGRTRTSRCYHARVRALVLPILFAAACGGDVIPDVTLSITLADGRTCRDASVITLLVGTGDPNDPAAQTFRCYDAEAPRAIDAKNLPLSDDVPLIGLSAQNAPLYRGHVVPADVVATPTAVLLYPDAAR